MLFEVQHRLDLVADHPAHRDAGPVADHRGHRLRIHDRQDQRAFALRSCQPGVCRPQLFHQIGPRPGRRSLGGGIVHGGPAFAQLCPQVEDFGDDHLFRRPPGIQLDQPLFLGLLHQGHARPARVDVESGGLVPADDFQLCLQRLDPLAGIIDFGRDRVLADRHAGAGGIKDRHRLVGQLARRNVAGRHRHRRLQPLVQHLNPVVLF